MERFIPENIYIEKSIEQLPLTRHIREALPHVPVVMVDGPIHEDRSITSGKRVLQVVRQQGRFLSACPGSPNVICCGYHVLNSAFNCNFDCTYCFLQSYVNNRIMTVYANIEDMFAEIDNYLAEHPEFTQEHPLRLGTGEFTDSLALDHVTGVSTRLIEYFSQKDNVLFELKTKSDALLNVLKGDVACLRRSASRRQAQRRLLSTKDTIILAWSLNTPRMIKENEYKTATLAKRLNAATHGAKAGYRIAFHFDPLIHYPGWEEEYRQVVDDMFKAVPAEQITWISLGTFRFNAPLKSIVRKRFPHNPIVTGEFIQGVDGKQRYVQEIRVEMYSKMLIWIREYSPSVLVYLCMETPVVWEKVFGERIESDAGLEKKFSQSLSRTR